MALTVVSSDHPNRAGILDAARRAAGVEDGRLVRILDVGTQDGNSFIVEEAMSGAESLATILLQGALPAEEARRIAGETATALETAGQRGLHHLRLTPLCVLRDHDGTIKISGVAIASAIDGPDGQEPDPVTASRRDAVCVVAVAYAALTTRWPLDEQVDGLEPAPRVVGGVAAPSEIAAGVPGDLDALCRMTLNEDTGPMTPGDFAAQIAPWSHGPVHRAVVDPTVVLQLPATGPAAAPTAPGENGTEPTAVMSTRDIPGYHPSPGPSTGPSPDPSPDPSTRSMEAVSRADGAGPGMAPTAADRTAAAGATATKAVGTVLASAGAAAGVVGGKVGSFARAAADKAAAATDKAAHSRADLGGERMTLREVFSAHSGEAEPPLPMLPDSTAQAPSRDQSKVVMMIVATFVVLSLLVAYCGTRGLGESSSRSSSTSRRPAVVTPPQVTQQAPPAAPEPTGPEPGRPVAILSAAGFDPQGDRSEKDSQAARVYDGNLDSAWTSEGYNSADFGGLKKGVGVVLDLGQPTSVQEATIDLGNEPVDLTVYAATSPSLDDASVIGTASAARGRIQVKPTSELPRAQYVIVWFTRLGPDGGRFRAAISEIALT